METVTISKKEYQKLLVAKKVAGKKTAQRSSSATFGILRNAPRSGATMLIKKTVSSGSTPKIKSYVFRAKLEHERDGRWSAWISTLPGCATAGRSREEALGALREAAQAYLEVLVKYGQSIPTAKTVETINAPVIAVTL